MLRQLFQHRLSLRPPFTVKTPSECNLLPSELPVSGTVLGIV